MLSFNYLASLKLTFLTLIKSYKKSILSSIGVSIGTLSVLLINIFSNYTIDVFNNEMTKLGVNGIVVSINSNSVTMDSQYINSLSNLNCIDEFTPYIFDEKCKINNQNEEVMTCGVINNFTDIYGQKLLYGKVFSSKCYDNVCIISKNLANKTFNSDNPIGNSLTLKFANKDINFKVIGVLEPDEKIASGITASLSKEKIYIPYNCFLLNKNINCINQIIITANNEYNLDNTLADIKSVSNKFIGKDNYEINNLVDQKNKILELLNIIKNCLFVISAISVLVSVTSVFNIMLMKVNERKKEIGIKKAIGATNNVIMLDFLCESSIIFFVGTLIGIIITFVIYCVLYVFVSKMFYFNITNCLAVFLVSIVLGIISGVYPSYKAAKLKPVDSIYKN